jgi:hypothetical protein
VISPSCFQEDAGGAKTKSLKLKGQINMNVAELNDFLNNDRYKLPSSRVSDFGQCWTVKDPGTYTIRVLPPHPVKCAGGVGLSIIHWGVAKSSIQCARMDEDYEARKVALNGGEPCLCCRLFEHFKKNEGQNKTMQEIRNNIRPQKVLLFPAYLPKVTAYQGKNPIIDESADPTMVVWNVPQYTLQKSMETIVKSNELLTDPARGKFIILTVTSDKTAKKYPSPDFFPMIGGAPIHSNPAMMARILDDLYPDVSKVAAGGKRKDEEIQKLILENAEIRPYIS